MFTYLMLYFNTNENRQLINSEIHNNLHLNKFTMLTFHLDCN
jgi:hypothetical protein